MLAEFEPPGERKARRAFDSLNGLSCIFFPCAKVWVQMDWIYPFLPLKPVRLGYEKSLTDVKKPLGAVHTRGLTKFLVKFFLRWTRVTLSLW
jgi:hypothetical protein